jgi:hypothetical protein
MFIVSWLGGSPHDKGEWIQILRDILASEFGSYRIVFTRGRRGWRFALEWRRGDEASDDALIANSPESVAFNIYVGLIGAGKPLDPTWKPGGA